MNKIHHKRRIQHGTAWLLTGLSALLSACQTPASEPFRHTDAAATKIAFDLDRLNASGLYGPADGLRSLAYEFCIPARQRYIDEIHAIDPDIRIYRQSPGSIGCHNDEYLCMGETHKQAWRQILTGLTSLPYVRKIIASPHE